MQGGPLTGSVHGGQQAIIGAHVYLMAANTTGYGSASVSLLNWTLTGHTDTVGGYVLTDGGGNFTLTGDYACTAGTQVYVYALGGNAGSGVNPAAGLLAALGGGGILGPDGIAIDGGGNVSISNQIHVGSAPGAGLTEMNNNGVAVSPSTGYLSSALFGADDVAVDGSGNVWVANGVQPVTYANGVNVVEFVGAGVPVVTPVATAVKNNMLGMRP